MALGALLAALTVEAGPPVETDGPARLYTVVIAAPDRDARTRVAQTGVAIDAIGPGTVTAIVDAAEEHVLGQEDAAAQGVALQRRAELRHRPAPIHGHQPGADPLPEAVDS